MPVESSAMTAEVLRKELDALGTRLENCFRRELGNFIQQLKTAEEKIHSVSSSDALGSPRKRKSRDGEDERFSSYASHDSNPKWDSQARSERVLKIQDNFETYEIDRAPRRRQSMPVKTFARRAYLSKADDPMRLLGNLDVDDFGDGHMAPKKEHQRSNPTSIRRSLRTSTTGYSWRSRSSTNLEESAGSTSFEALPCDAADEGYRKRCWKQVKDFVEGEAFDCLVGFFIMTNALVLGFQVDFMARRWLSPDEAPIAFTVINHVFCIIFTAELILRLCVYQDSFWMYLMNNFFDVAIVGFQILDEALGIAALLTQQGHGVSDHRDMSILRMLRILRLVRILRLARILHLVGELRVLVVSIFDSIRSLIWTIVLILLLTYTFAVYLTQLLTDYKLLHRDEVENDAESSILEFYGDLQRTMLCLYESILEGRHWHEMLEPLMKYCSWYDALVFIIYITCCLLALMNVVTSVFVTTALKHAEEDSKNVVMMKMRSFFNEVDSKKTGKISWDSFAGMLSHPVMMQFFKDVDIHTEQAWELFCLIDREGAMEVDIDDLVSDCLRLRGPARSIDLAIFVNEYERDMKAMPSTTADDDAASA